MLRVAARVANTCFRTSCHRFFFQNSRQKWFPEACFLQRNSKEGRLCAR